MSAPKAPTTRAPRGVGKTYVPAPCCCRALVSVCKNNFHYTIQKLAEYVVATIKNKASGQNSRPDGLNDQKRDGVQRRRTHQDQISAPTAQTTRNESACTAEARISTIFLKFNKIPSRSIKNSGIMKKNKQLCSEPAPGFQKREIS